MNRIMQSFLDTDTYVVNMSQVIWSQFPDAIGGFEYTNRSKDFKFPDNFGDHLMEQIRQWEDVTLDFEGAKWMSRAMPWIKPSYVEWLRGTRCFSPNYVKECRVVDGDLKLSVVGPLRHVGYFEVPVLYTIQQLARTSNFRTGEMGPIPSSDWETRTHEKGARLKKAGASFVNFGARRRYSSFVEDRVTEILTGYQPNSRGTSNMHFAKKYDIKPFGTIAHWLIMAMQAKYGFRLCNKMAMEHWVQEYRGSLGISLTDTITTPYFLKNDFDLYFAKLFDGTRPDSGDAFKMGDMIIDHYKHLGIDPTTKILVLADNLNVDKALALVDYFSNRIRVTIGMGTFLTNDVGVKHINHVMKLFAADFGHGAVDVVKLSDDVDKYTGKEEARNHALRELRMAQGV